jgi:hypothetical protein
VLGAGRYLLGAAEILALLAFASLGAAAVRRRLAPELTGATAVLGTIVLAATLLTLVAEALGTFSAFEAAPYLILSGIAGVGLWRFSSGWQGMRGVEDDRGSPAAPPSPDRTRSPIPMVPLLIALAIALIAVIDFADGARLRLDTGITGFDSTWYHGPFAAGFHQAGDTWSLHHIAPQFMAWFYPANAELFHAIGMNAFGRDLLSPLLNLGWFVGCLLACWAIGRPYRMGPASLALGSVALSVPALADQAGEMRNDIVGIFFLLAAVALAVGSRPTSTERGMRTGTLMLVGLAAGLAAGSKLNFLLPAAVMVVGLAAVAPPGRRARALAATAVPALLAGGYWYLRNLSHTGNPLPWFDSIGPLGLPGPDQKLGGREQHSVLSYLTDGGVWSDWFLPGLHDGFGLLWPLLAALALAGLFFALSRRASAPVRVAGLAGLAAALAWLVAPTSASGPEGIPRGFESGLRYLAPALVLGLALLPATPRARALLTRAGKRSGIGSGSGPRRGLGRGRGSSRGLNPQPPLSFVTRWVTNVRGRLGRTGLIVTASATLFAGVAVGYVVQREYLRDRYANPTFTTPGLNAAFKWATPISGARIATTSTRQYPLFGTDLDNEVEFVGESRPQGGFVAPTDCRSWRRLIDAGDYDYVVASRDRVEPGKPPYPPAARWTESPHAELVLAVPPTKVFRLTGPLNPSTCPG